MSALERVTECIVSAFWGHPLLTEWAAYAQLLSDGGDSSTAVSSDTERILLRVLLCSAKLAASGFDAIGALDDSGKVVAHGAFPTSHAATGVPPMAGSPNAKAAGPNANLEAFVSARDELTSALALPLPGLLSKVRGSSRPPGLSAHTSFSSLNDRVCHLSLQFGDDSVAVALLAGVVSQLSPGVFGLAKLAKPFSDLLYQLSQLFLKTTSVSPANRSFFRRA
jgi:hypothetical protein